MGTLLEPAKKGNTIIHSVHNNPDTHLGLLTLGGEGGGVLVGHPNGTKKSWKIMKSGFIVSDLQLSLKFCKDFDKFLPFLCVKLVSLLERRELPL